MTDSSARGRPRVAYQGVAGAFSELALDRLWGARVEGHPCATFDDVVAMVLDGVVPLGLLPVENSIAGPVQASVAAIAGSGLEVLGSTAMTITLCLLALPSATIESVTIAESHAVALRQCSVFLRAHPLIEPRVSGDTAGAAAAVAASGDRSRGAIASSRAGVLYGLTTLAEGIEDRSDNTTRFVIIGASGAGSLFRALEDESRSASLQG